MQTKTTITNGFAKTLTFQSLLFISLLFFTTNSFSQERNSAKPYSDEIQYEGYIIGIMPAEEGTFGYIILKDKEPILVQFHNPFTQTRKGLKKKEDAYKLAKWQVKQLKPEEIMKTKVNLSISKSVAKELAINID